MSKTVEQGVQIQLRVWTVNNAKTKSNSELTVVPMLQSALIYFYL
jgi:hypothetical protein